MNNDDQLIEPMNPDLWTFVVRAAQRGLAARNASLAARPYVDGVQVQAPAGPLEGPGAAAIPYDYAAALQRPVSRPTRSLFDVGVTYYPHSETVPAGPFEFTAHPAVGVGLFRGRPMAYIGLEADYRFVGKTHLPVGDGDRVASASGWKLTCERLSLQHLRGSDANDVPYTQTEFIHDSELPRDCTLMLGLLTRTRGAHAGLVQSLGNLFMPGPDHENYALGGVQIGESMLLKRGSLDIHRPQGLYVGYTGRFAGTVRLSSQDVMPEPTVPEPYLVLSSDDLVPPPEETQLVISPEMNLGMSPLHTGFFIGGVLTGVNILATFAASRSSNAKVRQVCVILQWATASCLIGTTFYVGASVCLNFAHGKNLYTKPEWVHSLGAAAPLRLTESEMTTSRVIGVGLGLCSAARLSTVIQALNSPQMFASLLLSLGVMKVCQPHVRRWFSTEPSTDGLVQK